MAKVTIKSLGILSVAKMYAILCFLMSLLIAIPYGIIMMIFGAALAGSSQEGAGIAAGGIAGGLMVMILIPILYAVIGFVGGIVMAAIYNLVANLVGGIEMELEGAGGALLSAPPQFQQPGQYQPGQYQQGSYPPNQPY